MEILTYLQLKIKGFYQRDEMLKVAFFCTFQYYFTISFNHENQKALELRTEDVKDCDEWVAAITHAR